MPRRTFIDDLADEELAGLLDDALDVIELTPADTPLVLAAASQEGPRRCRRCGCTDERGCPGGCSWVTSDLCSMCTR